MTAGLGCGVVRVTAGLWGRKGWGRGATKGRGGGQLGYWVSNGLRDDCRAMVVNWVTIELLGDNKASGSCPLGSEAITESWGDRQYGDCQVTAGLCGVTDSMVTVRPLTDSMVTVRPLTDSMVTVRPLTDSMVTVRPLTDSMVTVRHLTDSMVTVRPLTDSMVTVRPLTDSMVTVRPLTDIR